MRLLEVYSKLKTLKQPIVKTSAVAVFLGVTKATASKTLARLAEHNLVVHLRSGLWGIPELIDPLMLPEYLTAPFPSYISLQSALYYHGMVSQIPMIIYAISLARTKKYKTPLGIISVHHVQPEFFFGFKAIGKHRIKMATPEKALVDTLYLSTAKSRLFRSLPELEFPEYFSVNKANMIIRKIKSKKRRNLVTKRFANLIH